MTADSIELEYLASITLTPWQIGRVSPSIDCLLQFYDLQFVKNFIFVYRRDKGGYFACMKDVQK
jgi:hypothetical protein